MRRRKKVIDRSIAFKSFLSCKDVIKEVRNVNEIVFFLKNKYLLHKEERRTFIEDIPSQECLFTFEEMSDSI